MLVLDQSNTYLFSNMVVRITDNTVISDDTTTPTPEVPAFNVLIPTYQEVGMTNVMELYYPGERNRYLMAHGNPNCLKYGFGPDFIPEILGKFTSDSSVGVGVYTVNLRGASANTANVVCKCRWRVETNVPYTDTDGNPYYATPDGELTLEPTGNTPVIRDVLHLKYETEALPELKKWTELHAYLNEIYSDVEDDEGYRTVPVFAVMYRGATAYGNNAYFSLSPKTAEYDGHMYYSMSLYDGANFITTDPNYSFDPEAGQKYNTTYYIENMFNARFTNFRFLSAEMSEVLTNLIDQYLFSVDDYLAGNQANPSQTFTEVDLFNLNTFAIQMDMDSLNVQVNNAFQLTNGSDGTETPDELYEAFFRGDVIEDIASVIRYHINYIPDVGYNDATKREIINLVNKRTHMTVATLMLGGTDSLSSALIDHQANYYETMPCIRQLAKVQSPMMYNQWVRRTVAYPATYYDTMSLMDHFIRWSNFYQPFAGAQARWSGFIDDTLVTPSETVDTVQALYTNRVNTVMRDNESGAYLSEQMMNTILESDQTEFNNALLISNMLYDLVDLVHHNHFKFNEAEEVRQFNESVNDLINNKYAQHSASLSCEVYRAGTVGRAKSKNMIRVTIDLKDINKYTDVDLILTDA